MNVHKNLLSSNKRHGLVSSFPDQSFLPVPVSRLVMVKGWIRTGNTVRTTHTVTESFSPCVCTDGARWTETWMMSGCLMVMMWEADVD